MKINGPILAAIPLPYSDDESFWSRDLGLLVHGMRSLGADARVVAIGKPGNHAAGRPCILGSREDFENPLWWRQWNPAAVLFTGWSASRYNQIRRAILSATPRVIEKLDTSGVRSPRVWLWLYAMQAYTGRRDAEGSFQRLLAPGLTVLDVLAGYFPISRKIAGAMSLMPVLAAETPIAAERMRRFMHLYFKKIPQVVCLPHPVAEEYMRPDPNVIRKNRVVGVGRWNAHQKNFPLLLAVLEKFLENHPDWEAEVIGELPRGWNPETYFGGRALRPRLHFHGFKSHREVSAIYQQSKIFLMSSRHESFNIAAAEALCCGCSVVGPVDIASVPYFTGEASGTAACRQTRDHFLDALGAEADAWNSGLRNPDRISQKWLATVSAVAVGRKTLECFENMAGTTTGCSVGQA